MSKAVIRCRVLPGLFANEYYVLVNGSSAYYINKKHVTVKSEPTADKPVPGRVVVYVVQKTGKKILVQLPGEAALGGQRTWIDKTDIAAA